jgi:hypothetical protein
MQQIHTLEQGDMSIDEYYSAFDHLMGLLISMVPQCTTQQFIEKFFTYRFVMGVKLEFESIRSQLLHSSTLTMAHSLSDLLTEETRLRSMSTSHMTLPHNVLGAYCSGSKSNDNSSDPCVHYQKTNHCLDDCFIKYLEKLAAFCACLAAHGRGPPLPSGASMTVANVSPAASSVPHPPSTSAYGLPPGNPGWFWPSAPP